MEGLHISLKTETGVENSRWLCNIAKLTHFSKISSQLFAGDVQMCHMPYNNITSLKRTLEKSQSQFLSYRFSCMSGMQISHSFYLETTHAVPVKNSF